MLISFFGICKYRVYFSIVKKTLYTKNYQVFLELVYKIRVASNLRQIDLAKRLEAPQSFISKIESGERRVDLIELLEICRVMNVSIVDFVKELEKKINEAK